MEEYLRGVNGLDSKTRKSGFLQDHAKPTRDTHHRWASCRAQRSQDEASDCLLGVSVSLVSVPINPRSWMINRS